MKIFIGSSSEALEKAEVVASNLQLEGYNAITWNSIGVFSPSENALDNLISIVEEYDAAIFILAADDQVWYRKTKINKVRDNVIFEAGLFIGRKGKKRVLLVKDKGVEIPTDLDGTVSVEYNSKSEVEFKNNAVVKNKVSDWARGIRSSNHSQFKLAARSEMDNIISLEDRWKHAKEIRIVNFAATSFLASNKIGPNIEYKAEWAKLIEKKLEEGTNFKILLTMPGSYADYDASKSKMKVFLNTNVKPYYIISYAYKVLKELSDKQSKKRRSKVKKGSIEFKLTDVALPYGAIMVINDKAYKENNHIKVDLYSPYNSTDQERRSFYIFEEDRENYSFFNQNIVNMWNNAFSEIETENVCIHDLYKDFNFYSSSNFSFFMKKYEDEWVSQKCLYIYSSLIYFVIEGEMKITYWKGGQEYNKLITKGKLVVLPKAMIHQYKVKEGGKIFVLKSLYCKNMEDDKVEKDVDFIF